MNKIVAPVCCGKSCKAYARVYKVGKIAHSIEHGFKCVVCNRHSIPYNSGISAFWAAYSLELDRIREKAIAEETCEFDKC
jgi:hypothetical protein